MIYLLLLGLILLLVIAFYINKKSLSSPSVVFIVGFVFQSIWASLYKAKWDLNLGLQTFLVIFLGALEFLIVSYIVHLIIDVKHKDYNIKKIDIQIINVNKYMEIAFLVISIIISLAFLYYVVASVNGSFDGIGSIMNAISKFNDATKFIYC